jgi:hypothetical protein
MSREERQRLLHDGSTTSTTTTMSAYVEIVFDSKLRLAGTCTTELMTQTPMDDSPPTTLSCIYAVRSVLKRMNTH